MSAEKLHETLNELHRQLEATPEIDGQARAHLTAAMDEIRASLAATEVKAPGEPTDDGPVDRLRGLVEHFEEEHPVLSARLVDLIAILRSMGF